MSVRYQGQARLKVTGIDPARMPTLVEEFQSALDSASRGDRQVESVVVSHDPPTAIVVDMILIADGDEYLDDVADSLLRKALAEVSEQEPAQEHVTALGSTLVPA